MSRELHPKRHMVSYVRCTSCEAARITAASNSIARAFHRAPTDCRIHQASSQATRQHGMCAGIQVGCAGWHRGAGTNYIYAWTESRRSFASAGSRHLDTMKQATGKSCGTVAFGSEPDILPSQEVLSTAFSALEADLRNVCRSYRRESREPRRAEVAHRRAVATALRAGEAEAALTP